MRPAIWQVRAALGAAYIVLAASLAGLQAPRPIDKAGLFEAVRLRGLSTDEMVGLVRERGVAFRLSGDDEAQLVKLGAERRLIEAVRENFRGVEAVPAAREDVSAAKKEPPPPAAKEAAPPAADIALPEGPPLTRHQVVLLLQAGVAPGAITRLVEKRGVDFALNREIAGEILAAGGTNTVVGVVAIMQKERPAPSTPVRVPPAEQAARLIHRQPPVYPAAAASKGISGAVRLEVTIAADGTVKNVRALDGPAPLQAAAVEAVKRWRYQPTLVNNQPVETITEVEVQFNLLR